MATKISQAEARRLRAENEQLRRERLARLPAGRHRQQPQAMADALNG